MLTFVVQPLIAMAIGVAVLMRPMLLAFLVVYLIAASIFTLSVMSA